MADVFLSSKFWFGLGEIAYLNLLLSGDNALVIALAVKALPKRRRILGQVWGAVGAVALRLIFLAIVSYLLEIPLLKFVGGLFLVWISFKLVKAETGAEAEVRGGVSLWDAIWIIIVADVTMSLDNVLAVAAAARGDLLLITFGIGLSLPIVIWGAGLLARLMNRYAWIVWIGGGILGRVAGDMMLEDRAVRGWFGEFVEPFRISVPFGSINVHPFSLILGIALAGLGWWFARTPHAKIPENV